MIIIYSIIIEYNKDTIVKWISTTKDDLIKNGRIQKFEYCAELAWKLSKMYLELSEGILSNSPKSVYKSMFQSALITENEFLSLFKTIEDRNLLSHIYKEEMYLAVYENLKSHLIAFKMLLGKLDKMPE